MHGVPSTPLVSIIIPTYNRPAYLREALESAVRQTYKNVEILVSDNCSFKNPQSIVDSFHDSRIQFYRNSTNLGMFANAMNAFGKARGKYVASLLDDDRWEPEFLAKLVPALEAHPEASVAFCPHFVINAQGKVDWQATRKNARDYKTKFLRPGLHQPFIKIGLIDQSPSLAMAALIRREAVNWQDIPAEVGAVWDLYLTYLCSRSGQAAYYHPERLTYVRIHPTSETYSYHRKNIAANLQKMKSHVFCYEQFIKDERLVEFRPIFRQRWAFYKTSVGINLLRAKQPTSARQYILSALRQHLSLRAILALVLSFTPSTLTSQL